VAGEGAAFEEHVATPHRLDFAHAAALYGCAYVPVAEPQAFRAAVDAGLRSSGTTIVHVRTDREENVAVHRRVWESVRAAL
jgi:2-succinyl-5-enolpyruvyl-6-hydroxy-3-cyclohexene-1-carboxylate synthase